MPARGTTSWQAALKYLACRDHSAQELSVKLRNKGYAVEEIHQTVEDLLAQDFLHDARFAQHYVRNCVERGYGPVKITCALRQRGIDDTLTQQALDEAEVDWQAQIQRVWTKRFHAAGLQSGKEKVKQQRFLIARGFTLEQIRGLFAALPVI